MVVRGNAEKLADLNNLPESFFLITNVESLRDTAVLDRIVALCDSGEIGMVAVDEIHKCKNSTSQQGKALLKVKPQIRVAMTGTPLLNRPLDLYIILKWLGEESHSFYAFRKHFCVMGGYGGYEVVSYKNLNELQARLADIMLRRLKEDVLDLPEKVRQTEYVEMDTTQRKIYDQVSAELRADIDRIKVSNNPLAQLIRLRQATADTDILCSEVSVSAKFDRMEALVEEATDNGRKVLIFSNWTEVTNRAKERLSGYNPVVITGETSPEERAQSQKVFTEDANCKVCIGTIGAMGTGLTLTAATVEIFLDSPWNRATKEQAEDRAHRIGTTESVNIITLVCKDTIDERIEEIVYKKGVMADMLVDGVACKDNAGLVDYLLS
jgi:SNF2 family DNA or RNA helicase